MRMSYRRSQSNQGIDVSRLKRLIHPSDLDDINQYNQIRNLPDLSIKLFVLRHGQSVANREKIIASCTKKDSSRFGLTPEGIIKIRSSIVEARDKGLIASSSIIFSSPFLRALESAQIAASLLGAPNPEIDQRLRERNFGELNGKSDTEYETMWNYDSLDPIDAPFGGESVAQVLFGISNLVGELNQRFNGQTVIIVGHGDPLNILASAMAGKPPQLHSKNQQLETGELRELCLQGRPYLSRPS